MHRGRGRGYDNGGLIGARGGCTAGTNRHVWVSSPTPPTAGNPRLPGPVLQIKNRNAIQAISTMAAEYFSPASTRPSPMMPAVSPEKNPWISAEWEKSRL
jgi:hypothetical protein